MAPSTKQRGVLFCISLAMFVVATRGAGKLPNASHGVEDQEMVIVVGPHGGYSHTKLPMPSSLAECYLWPNTVLTQDMFETNTHGSSTTRPQHVATGASEEPSGDPDDEENVELHSNDEGGRGDWTAMALQALL